MSVKNCGYTLSKSFVLNYSFASLKRHKHFYCNIESMEDEQEVDSVSVKCSDKIKQVAAEIQRVIKHTHSQYVM